MPGLVPGIHVLRQEQNIKDVDGRDKPGHDDVAGGITNPRTHYLGRNRFAGGVAASCGHRQPKEVVMTHVPMSRPLRLILLADAAASGATAALLVAGAGLLER